MPTNDPLAMSDEQNAIMLQYAKETASGGTPSPELVQKLNSAELRVGSEQFRAQLLVARHNQDVIDHVKQTVAQYQNWGVSISELPAYELHPMLWKVVQVPDGFGGYDWTWAVDKPYQG